MFLDSIKLTGKLEIFVGDELMQVVNNTVVTSGKNYIAGLLSSGSAFTGNFMQLGTGTTAVTLADTAVQTPQGTRVAGSLSSAGAVLQIDSLFPAGNPAAQQNISEAGLYTASTGGILVARSVFSPVGKETTDSLRIIWSITVA